jgi:GT2 family glycosyltransferase
VQGPERLLPLSTITVGYKGAKHLRRMLDSLLESTPPPAQVIVVDNASPEPLEPVFGAFAPLARRRGMRPLFVSAPKNLGFGAGSALGLEHATEPFVMLVNPDTEVPPMTLQRLLDAARQLPEPCAVQPLLLYADRREVINSAGIAAFLDGTCIDLLSGAPLERLAARGPTEIAGVTGACALFPRDFAERFGFFDPAYFLYFEDADLGLRWLRQGVRAYLVPDAVMYHVWHGSSGEAGGDLEVETLRNQLRTVAKNYPPLEAAISAFAWAAVTLSYLAWRGKPQLARQRMRAAAAEVRLFPKLRTARRAVRALGPDGRVRPWIVIPKRPAYAHPPMRR